MSYIHLHARTHLITPLGEQVHACVGTWGKGKTEGKGEGQVKGKERVQVHVR